MTRILLILIMAAMATVLPAQTRQPWEEYLAQTGLAEDVESADLEARYDDLCELAANRLNLNTAQREDMERLPLLTYDQMVSLIAYRDRVGAIRSWDELRVAGIGDDRLRGLLPYFAYLGEPEQAGHRLTMADLLRYGHHEAVAYMGLPCYDRRGDHEGYQGYPYRHWMRYTYNYGQDVRAALVGAQDAGEPFMAGPNRLGYDYYSFYLQLRHRGWLRSLVVGRYRLRLGMGLIMNTNYGFGKLAVLSTMGRTAPVITGHSSRSEANYLQGAAATMALTRRVAVTLFGSYRRVDATLNADSATVATLLRTGYHRTQSEIDRRHNTAQALGGASVAYSHGGLRVGLSGVYSHYNRPLRPDTTALYRRYAPMGSGFWNLSVDYAYRAHGFELTGETATGDGGGLATVNRVVYSPVQRLSLMAVQRFYSYRYHALQGRSIAEGGQVSNESGVYLGAQWSLSHGWTARAYTDYAYFAWPRYGLSFSSHVWDHLLEAEYRRGSVVWQTRYRLKHRQTDAADHSHLIDYATHRGQTSVAGQWGRVGAKSVVGVAYSAKGRGSLGWLVGQWLRYGTDRWQVSGSVAYFDTDDYESRLYYYERGLLYTFGFPSYYGQGLHYAVSVRADLSRHVQAAVRAGTTNYMDRDHISSGLQQIDRSSQTDVEMQLRLRF